MSAACERCGADLGIGALVCAGCRAFVHARRLGELDAEAKRAESEGRVADARARLDEMLGLVPDATVQRRAIEARIASIATPALTETAEPAKPKWVAALGAFGLVVWKLKGVLLVVLTKLKFILLAVGHWKTFLSMAAAFGVYWSIWGWPFALGFVLSIYVHELGHVAALRYYRIPASAPMFIPGFGAFVRLKAPPPNDTVDARIGLAGPIAGLVATFGSLAIALAMHSRLFAAIAFTSAFINLINLAPAFSLDGARAYRPMTRMQRLACGIALGFAGIVVKDGMFVLVAIAAVVQLFRTPSEEGDGDGAIAFLVVVGALVLALVQARALAGG